MRLFPEEYLPTLNDQLSLSQQHITPGDHVLRVMEDGLVIAARTLTLEEFIRGEKALAIPSREPFDERFERQRQEARQSQGYLYGWWSSSIERGEWGSVHRASLTCSITQEVYEDLMRDWDARPMPLKFE